MKTHLFVAFICLLVGCNNETKTYEDKIDSASVKLDSLGNKIGDVVNNTADSLLPNLGKLKDSALAKGGRLSDSLRVKGGRMKDSLNKRRRDTTRH
ncbi:MAG TPA: hypothetical protein VF622_12735 [Segetibacter sp.]|jgi:hypothetical protein